MVLILLPFLVVSALLTVALRPSRLWPMITVVAVLASGVMIQGYALVDEVLAGAVILGVLLPVAVHRITLGRSHLTHPAYAVFFLLIVYMGAQGLRSVILLEDWRMSRWVVYYLIIGVIAWLTAKRRFTIPGGQRVAWLITFSGFFYLGLYVASGVVTEAVFGTSRWDLQGVSWAGSAYALFPLALIMPTAVFLLADRRRLIRLTAIATILMAMIAAFYYQSRISWLVILAFLVLSPTVLGLRKRVLIYGLGLVALVLFVASHYGVDLGAYAQSLLESAQAIYAPRSSDLDRRLHLAAAFEAVSLDPRLLIVGGGAYSHRETLVPYVRELYAEFLPQVMVPNVVRTTGFSALLVDTGMIGIVLIASMAVFTAKEIFDRSRESRGRRPVLFFSLAIMLLWLLVSDIRDILLFYVAMMPSGLLAQLSQAYRGN